MEPESHSQVFVQRSVFYEGARQTFVDSGLLKNFNGGPVFAIGLPRDFFLRIRFSLLIMGRHYQIC